MRAPDPMSDEPTITRSGRRLTEADLDGLVADAEAGYDLTTWRPHRPSTWIAIDGPKRFELVEDDSGSWVYAYVTWGAKLTTVGGLARTIPFASPSAAFAWTLEQYQLPISTWARQETPSERRRIINDAWGR